MSDNLKDILARAKENGATQSQMLALIQLYSKKKDSSESPSTGEEETTNTASTPESEPAQLERPSAPNWIKDIRDGSPRLDRGVKLPKRGEQTEGEKAAQERKEEVEASALGQLSEEERAASDYTEYESIYDEAGVPEELRKEDLFGGAGLVLGKFALEDAAQARRANNVSREYEELFEEKTVSRSFVSGLGDFQQPQRIAPKAESMTESELEAAKVDVARRMNEIMGFDMMNPYEDTKERVYDKYEYNKGILSEISLEKAKDEWRKDKGVTTKGEVLLGSAFGLDDFFEGLYGATVDPVVKKIGANAAIAFYDATGQGEKAEMVSGMIQESDLKNMMDVGLDPNDQRGITETFQEGETGLAALKALYFGSQSVGLMAATIAQPEIGIALMATSSGLDTYTGFRDRLDMSAEDKAMLAISAGAAEVMMGKVLGGLGNVRRFRNAIGISDDIGKASMVARKNAYDKALDFLKPYSNKVKAAKANPALRAAGRYAYDTTGEAIEELAVEATNQFMAHIIAGEEFDSYALADATLLGGGMGGGMSVFTARQVYGIESSLYNKPLNKDIDKYEEIQAMYSDLKQASRDIDSETKSLRKQARSESDPSKRAALVAQADKLTGRKKVMLQEAKKLRSEGLDLINKSREAYDKLDVNEKAQLVDINKRITGVIRDVKDATNKTVKSRKKNELAGLLLRKAEIEAKAGIELQLDGQQEQGMADVAAMETASVNMQEDAVPLQTAVDMVQDLKAKREARIEEAKQRTNKSTPSKLIDKRVRFLNPATNETVEGTLIKDGQRLAVETDEGNIIDIDLYERSSERPLSELGLSEAESILRPNEDGSFTYRASGGAAPQGTRMVNNNGVKAIRRNKDGSVKNVTLTSPDGSQTFNLKGQDAEEAAYQILMKERQTPEGAAKVDEEFRKDAEARAILQQEAQKEAGAAVSPTQAEPEAEAPLPLTAEERVKNIERLPKNAQEAVVRMLGAVMHLSPNQTVEVLNTNEEVKAKWLELGGSDTKRIKGFNDPSTNTIYISREGTMSDRRSDGLHILQHEMIHPILNAIIATDPIFFEKIYNQGLDLILNAKNNRVAQLVYAHASQYKGDKFKEELLVEFFNFMSNESNLQEVLKEQPSFKTKLINFINSILERLGIPYQLNVKSPDSELLQVLAQIRDGFASGTPVDVAKTEENRATGLQAYLGQQEAVLETLGLEEAKKVVGLLEGGYEAFFQGAGAVADRGWNQFSGITAADNANSKPRLLKEVSRFLAEKPVLFVNKSVIDELGSEDAAKLLEVMQNMGYTLKDKSVGLVFSAPAFNNLLGEGTAGLEAVQASSFISSDAAFSNIAELAPQAVANVPVIDTVADMLGTDVKYIYNNSINVASGYLKPNASNGLKKPAVVVNLAKVDEATSMFGLAAFMVENLRKSEGVVGKASSYLYGLEGEIREASNRLESAPETLTARDKKVLLPLLFRMESYLSQTSQEGQKVGAAEKQYGFELGNALVFAVTEQISKDLSSLSGGYIPEHGLPHDIEQAFLNNLNQKLEVDIESSRFMPMADFLKMVFVDKALDKVDKKPKVTNTGAKIKNKLKELLAGSGAIKNQIRQVLNGRSTTIGSKSKDLLDYAIKAIEHRIRKSEVKQRIKELEKDNGLNLVPTNFISFKGLVQSIAFLNNDFMNFYGSIERMHPLFDAYRSLSEGINNIMTNSTKPRSRQSIESFDVFEEVREFEKTKKVFLFQIGNALDSGTPVDVISNSLKSLLRATMPQELITELNSEGFDLNSDSVKGMINGLSVYQRQLFFTVYPFLNPKAFAEVISPLIEDINNSSQQAMNVDEDEYGTIGYTAYAHDEYQYANSQAYTKSSNIKTALELDVFNKSNENHIAAVLDALDFFGDFYIGEVADITLDLAGAFPSAYENNITDLYENADGMDMMMLYTALDTSILKVMPIGKPVDYMKSEAELQAWQSSQQINVPQEVTEELEQLRQELNEPDNDYSDLAVMGKADRIGINRYDFLDEIESIDSRNKLDSIKEAFEKSDVNKDEGKLDEKIEKMDEAEAVRELAEAVKKTSSYISVENSKEILLKLPKAPKGYQYGVYKVSYGTAFRGDQSVEFSSNFTLSTVTDMMREEGISEEEIKAYEQQRKEAVKVFAKAGLPDIATRLGMYSNVPSSWDAGRAIATPLMEFIHTRALQTGNTYVSFSPVEDKVQEEYRFKNLVDKGLTEEEAAAYGFTDTEGMTFDNEFRRILYNTWAERRMGDAVLVTKNQQTEMVSTSDGKVFLTGKRASSQVAKIIGKDQAKLIANYYKKYPNRVKQASRADSLDELRERVASEIEAEGVKPLTVDQMVEIARVSGVAMDRNTIESNPENFAFAYSERSILRSGLGDTILLPVTMTYLSRNQDGVLSTPPLTQEADISESELQAYIDGNAEEQLLIEQMEDMRQRNEKAVLEATKSKWWTWDSISKAWINRNQALREALEKGLGAYTRSVLTRRNGAIRYADKLFKEYESSIFKGLTVGDEKTLDDIIFLRRVIQIDKNRDFKRETAQAELELEESSLKSLQQSVKDIKDKAKVEEIKKDISAKKAYISELKNRIEQNQRPKHPSSPSFDMEMNLENATKTLASIEARLGSKKYNKMTQRVDKFFDAFSDILEMAYDAGLINESTYDRFKSDDYAPRVFLEHFFGDSHNSMYQGTNLSEEYIMSLKEGSNQEIFTDARMLLSMALRSVRAKAHQNELMSVMHEVARSKDFEGVPFMKELNKSEGGTVNKADKGFVNVFYRVDGNLEGFQIEAKLEPMLKGNVKDYVNIPPKFKSLISKASGTAPVKLFATGTSTAFAVTAFMRFIPEVVFGRGVYDKKGKGFVPLMMSYAAIDSLIGLKDAVFNPALVEEYMKNGGATTWMAAMGKPKAVVRRGKKSLVSSVADKLVRSIMNAASFAGEKSELAVRLAIYSRTKKNLKEQFPQMPEAELQSLAAEEALLLADFATSGTVSKTLDTISPYLNAGIQGFRGAASYAKNNPKMFASKISQMFTGSFAIYLLSMLSMEDDEWDRISDYKKQMNTLIPLGRDKDGNMRFLEIPRAHTFLPVTAIAEVTARAVKDMIRGNEVVFEEDKNSRLIEDGSYIMDSFLKSMPTPSLSPVVNLYIAYQHNWDTWRNGKIYNKGGNKDMQKYIEGQYDPKVRDFYKVLALEMYEKGIDVSAKRMQVAIEKIIVGDKNILVDQIYDFADAIALAGDRADKLREKHGIVLNDKTATEKAKNIMTLLGLKGRFYVTPEKDYSKSRRVTKIKEKENTEVFKQKQAVKSLAQPLLGKKLTGNIPSRYLNEIKKIAGGDAMREVRLIRYFMYIQRGNLVDNQIVDIAWSDNEKQSVAMIEEIYKKPVSSITDYEFEQVIKDLAVYGLRKSELERLVLEFENQKKQK